MKVRLLALVNVLLIPYVWAKFPREARSYTRRSLEAVMAGANSYYRVCHAAKGAHDE